MEDILTAILKTIVTLGGLFAGAAAVGAGLHCGLRAGARWFGPIQTTVVKHTYRHDMDREGA